MPQPCTVINSNENESDVVININITNYKIKFPKPYSYHMVPKIKLLKRQLDIIISCKFRRSIKALKKSYRFFFDVCNGN